MQPSHRKARPPAKKRHTKPCKFFQYSKCPYTAEDCDFLHILTNDGSPQSAGPCRYFAAGICGNGSRCRFKHVPLPTQDFGDTQNGASAPMADINQQDSPVEVSPTNSRPKPGTMPFSPSMPGWVRPYNGPSGPPTYPPGLPPAPQVYYSEFYTRNNGRTLSNSNSTSSSLSDDAFLVTEDPNYSEHYHQYQSRVRIVDEQPLIHIPPFYRPPVVPPGSLSIDTSFGAQQGIYSAYNYAPLVSPVVPFKPIGRARSKSEIRHKTANYKTKPCKFYRADGVCPNGSRCTFIHTGSSPPNSPPSSPTNEIPLPVPPSATLPPKPLTAAEENKKKNFFPISWRVIGGGVLMGSESNGKSFIKPGRSQGENVETMHETFLEDPEPKIEDTSPPKPIKRTRSSSIPPTPSIQHIDTGTLFSAESPGNL